MPFYTYECKRCDTKADELVKMNTESTICKQCGEPTVKLPSFRFNATGLPNGFASSRRPPK